MAFLGRLKRVRNGLNKIGLLIALAVCACIVYFDGAISIVWIAFLVLAWAAPLILVLIIIMSLVYFIANERVQQVTATRFWHEKWDTERQNDALLHPASSSPSLELMRPVVDSSDSEGELVRAVNGESQTG